MRLIHRLPDGQLAMEQFLDEGKRPPYAILSHVWGQPQQEVTFADFEGNDWRDKTEGCRKIDFCAKRIQEDDIDYFWIDTCCIDKRHSAELDEALTSMFNWYEQAVKCYVYLVDVSHEGMRKDVVKQQSWEHAFERSKWFQRGWTLQELIAPRSVLFFSRQGTLLCSKRTKEALISEISGIPGRALRGHSLRSFSVEERMSWVRGRQTTRKEDAAYCLRGLFEVYMSTLYGEGDNAMLRLKREIQTLDVESPNEKTPYDKMTKSLSYRGIEERYLGIHRHHKATCKWIVQSQQYLDWQDQARRGDHHGIFWIKGKPGSGKSTMVKYLFDKVKTEAKDSLVISFFFSARASILERTTIGLYRSLLHQILSALRRSHPHFTISERSSASSRWTLSRLQHVFEQVIAHLPLPLIIFVDALDECAGSEVQEMLSVFETLAEESLSAEKKLYICLSSRHYPRVEIDRCVELVLENQEPHSLDITRYLNSALKIGTGPQIRHIKEEIRRRAAGVFIWVVLVIKLLNTHHARGMVHKLSQALQDIPDDLDTLFGNIITRDAENPAELMLALQWILYAQRPLSPVELYAGVLSGLANAEIIPWNPDDIPEDAVKRFVASSTKGLAEVTMGKEARVQFIHESVRDFLRRRNRASGAQSEFQMDDSSHSHQKLRKSCQRYLNSVVDCPAIWARLQHFEAMLLQEDRSDPQSLTAYMTKLFPMVEYTVRHLPYHANLAQAEGLEQTDFMRDFPDRPWIIIYNVFHSRKYRYTNNRRNDRDYILAELGCNHLLKSLTGPEPFGPSTRQPFVWPFLIAILRGHNDTAMTLLRLDNSRLQDSQYVQLLRSEVDILCAAPQTQPVKHWRLSRFFLQNDCLVLALYCYTIRGLTGFGEDLTDLGQEVEWRGTSLEERFERVIALCPTARSHGSIINNEFWSAIYMGQFRAAKLLLQLGARIVPNDDGERRLLCQAMSMGYLTPDMIEVLMNEAISSKASQGLNLTSALILAASAGLLHIVTALLDADDRLNSKALDYGWDYFSVLEKASQRGHEKIVKATLHVISANRIHLRDGLFRRDFLRRHFDSAIHCAKCCGYTDIENILRSAERSMIEAQVSEAGSQS